MFPSLLDARGASKSRTLARGKADLCLELCKAAGNNLGCIPAGHDGEGWVQGWMGVVRAALLGVLWWSPGLQCVPLPARQCLDVSTEGSHLQPPQRVSSLGLSPSAGSSSPCPPERCLAEGTSRMVSPGGCPASRTGCHDSEGSGPAPSWLAPLPGLFPRRENNASLSIQETFIT